MTTQSELNWQDWQATDKLRLLYRLRTIPTPTQITILPTFDRWLHTTTPAYNWEWSYIQHVRSALDRVTAGDLKRLIIQLPPRHGKSSLVTVRYAAYRLIRDPRMQVIIGGYNKDLAVKFSRAVRTIARQQTAISNERAAADEWETLDGGGLRAVGMGSGVTGTGGDLIIVDDPVKNREEAESEKYRDNVYDWYTNDLYTRLEPGAALILIMTRWHLDDLAGRILASADGSRWELISLPAIAEDGDPLGRPAGAALCPDRFPLPTLGEIKGVLGIDFEALYQQRPQAREGGAFKLQWFKLCDEVPAKAKRVRWWDKAATDAGGDYTVGVLIAQADKQWYIEDVVRGQWGAGERDKIMRATAEQDKLTYGHVEYWGPQDPGQAGKADAAAFASLLAGFVVKTQPETGPKATRASVIAAQLWAGNVWTKRAPWTAKFIQELCEFPSAAHDDQVDAASGAFSKLPPHNADSWITYYKQLLQGAPAPGPADHNGNGHSLVPVLPADADADAIYEIEVPPGAPVGGLQAIEQERKQLGRDAPRIAGQWAKPRRT